jgi:DNA polymerase
VQQLACGFGVGADKFRDFARGYKLILSKAEAKDGVDGWRKLHPEIADRNTGGWARCQRALTYIEAGQEYQIDPWGLTHTCSEGIVLPDGRLIRYDSLRRQVNEKTGYEEWKYGRGRHTTYIYGGKMDENIVQALARIVLMDNVIEFWKRTGLRTQLRVYDEAVYVVDERHAEALLKELLSIMRTPPKWWPELVTWSEGDMALSYGVAK